jgi:hypothetical protein
VKRFGVGVLVVASLYFFTNILSAVIFTTYIGLGSTLSLDIAFTVISVLNIISNPMRTFPMFLGSLIDLTVSLNRIQDFLIIDEINPTQIKQIS